MKKEKLVFENHDVFVIPSTESNYLVYSPTLGKLIKVSGKMVDKLEMYGLEGYLNDEDIYALYLELKEALPNAVQPINVYAQKSKVFPLTLALTKECSLKCLYCHSDAGRKEEMTLEIMEASLKHAFDTAKEDNLNGVSVSFYTSGEPTYNWSMFTTCIKRIKEYENAYNIPVHLNMTTNGYYGIEKQQFIAEHFDNILLSLDGPPEIQNLHRPAVDNGDSYLKAKESALYFIKNVKSFSIRSTVSNLSVSKMPYIVEYFNKEFGNQFDIVFEPLTLLGRANENLDLLTGPNQKDFVNYFIQAKEKGKELGIEVVNSNILKRNRLVTNNCAAISAPGFNVTTDGIVTSCGRDTDGDIFGYGRYCSETNSFSLDKERINFIKEKGEIQEKCNDCFSKYHCAGDCPDSRRVENKCYMIKELIRYELETLLA